MRQTLTLTLVTSVLVGGALLAQSPGTSGPSSAKAAQGAGLFQAYCAGCHGRGGTGDGDIAEMLKVKPANLTVIAEGNNGSFDLEKVVRIIDGRRKVKGHGQGQMPIWGDALQIASGGATEEEAMAKIESLAHFLWTLQK